MVKKTWIDITDFIDWQGNFTGIQRVEYELAKRYNNEPQTNFFYYNPLTNSFYETSFDIIEEKAKIVSGEQGLKGVKQPAIRLSSRVSAKVKSIIPERAKSPLKKVKRKIQNTSQAIPLEPRHPFKNNDIVVVLGGNWGLGTYMPSMRKVLDTNKSIKFVHVIYDMIPVMQPGYFPEGLEGTFGTYFTHVLESADLCVSISDYSKQDAIKFADKSQVRCPRIETFRLGDDFVKIPPKKPEANIGNNEFIFVGGTFEIRKNHQLLYYVYKLSKQRNINLPKLVIAGKKGWLSEQTLHLFNNDPDMNDVVILHNVTDSEMAWLYENCKFSIYPSFYEGWGLPIAESLRYGSYVIASDSSSMPEVAGKLIDYFSPFNTEECLNLIDSTNNKSSSELNQIASNYKTTSWDNTYNQFKELVSNIN